MPRIKSSTSSLSVQDLTRSLVQWYSQNKRHLPWRRSRDPYRIWISEVMLQQTTVTAVVPYFERFLEQFPTLESLAQAPQPEVLRLWAGLGYYSRARNLHLAAQTLVLHEKFPQTWQELIKAPGFGPYTSRAVSSLAFSEPVGVLDGNVIRVLLRLKNWDVDWWQPAARARLQVEVDRFANAGEDSAEVNQALMELGATVCTPKSPSCLICPWAKDCQALKAGRVPQLPKPKPKRKTELWLWEPQIRLDSLKNPNRVWIEKNNYAPFLRGQWLFPGRARQTLKRPKNGIFKHMITHHEIWVVPKYQKSKASTPSQGRWVYIVGLSKSNPSSLLQKALQPILKGILIFSFFTSGCSTPKIDMKSESAKPSDPSKSGVLTSEPWRRYGESEVTSPPAPANFKPAKVVLLPISMEARTPRFAPSGRRLLFVSRGSDARSQPQVHEFDFVTQKTRRLVFDAGTNAEPQPLDDKGNFVYLSNTDSIKERGAQQLLSDPNSTLTASPLDIYLRYGKDQVARLTHSMESEGSISMILPKPANRARQLVFPLQFLFTERSGGGQTSVHEGTLWLSSPPRFASYSMFKGERPLLLSPQMQPRGRDMAWIEGSQLQDRELIHMKRGPQAMAPRSVLTPQPMTLENFAWHPEGDWIVFSGSFSPREKLALYAVRTRGGCLTRLTYTLGHDFEPNFSPDGSSLAFTSDRSKRDQIYLMEFNPPQTCAETPR